MRTFLGIIMKLIGTFISTWICFGLIEKNMLLWIFIVSLAITIINYLISDLLVLPNSSNVVASLTDAVGAGIIAFIISLLTDNFYITWLSTIIFIVIIYVFEFFLHKYQVEE